MCSFTLFCYTFTFRVSILSHHYIAAVLFILATSLTFPDLYCTLIHLHTSLRAHSCPGMCVALLGAPYWLLLQLHIIHIGTALRVAVCLAYWLYMILNIGLISLLLFVWFLLPVLLFHKCGLILFQFWCSLLRCSTASSVILVSLFQFLACTLVPMTYGSSIDVSVFLPRP
jgi:hypothetical protein